MRLSIGSGILFSVLALCITFLVGLVIIKQEIPKLLALEVQHLGIRVLANEIQLENFSDIISIQTEARKFRRAIKKFSAVGGR